MGTQWAWFEMKVQERTPTLGPSKSAKTFPKHNGWKSSLVLLPSILAQISPLWSSYHQALLPPHVFLPLSDNDSLISSPGYTHQTPSSLAKVEKMQYSAAILLPWDRTTALLQPFLHCQHTLVDFFVCMFVLQGFEKSISVDAFLRILQGKARKEAFLSGFPS